MRVMCREHEERFGPGGHGEGVYASDALQNHASHCPDIVISNRVDQNGCRGLCRGHTRLARTQP